MAADGDDLRGYRWVPKSVKTRGLDGRSSIAVVKTTQAPVREGEVDWAKESARAPASGLSVVLRREIEKTDGEWTLHAWFEDLEIFRNRKRPDLSDAYYLGAVTALILAVDAERMFRRAVEQSSGTKIAVRIDRGELRGDMDAYFIGSVRRLLRDSAVRIEPTDADGGPTILIHEDPL